MPITGEVLEVNPKLDDQPELVNKDPYGEGWIIKISIEEKAELNKLLSSDAYKTLIGQ
ncbi:Glycine cleavage system H protein [bioreactor metagenome]|uniref:Glycine cleavage system H protein n=1 Tax=bioreactor metagenome TaxID=1076179 RepID=A0A645HLH1_9ZZZZ